MLNKKFTRPTTSAQTIEEWVALAAALIASGILIRWVLQSCCLGLDFTDEGFYLNWIANPSLYKSSHTQFGFVYHPLYRLLGSDVASLRQANILLSLFLAWILCLQVFRLVLVRKHAETECLWPYAGLALVIATNTLALLYLWLPTPNYNSLALQALLIAAIGILLAEADTTRSSCLGWVLIGVSGWLAFMAKPTTAVALSLVVFAYLIVAGKLKMRLLAISLITAIMLLLLSAWLIDGSIAGFSIRLANGAEDMKQMQGGYSLAAILRWDVLDFSNYKRNSIAGIAVFICGCTCLGLSTKRVLRIAAALATLLIFSLSIAVVTGTNVLHPPQSGMHGIQYWAAPLGALLAAACLRSKQFSQPSSRKHWALVIFFLVLPLVYTLGTNGNYWIAATGAVIFWVMAGNIILTLIQRDKLAWPHFLPLAAVAQLGIIMILKISTEHPYRQTQPLRQNSDMIKIAVTGSPLWLSHDFADYLRKLDHLARRNGFKDGDEMIDFTGHYSTALYAIGAKAIGTLLLGGYPGSNDIASAALDRIPREQLRKAWILTEPTGQRKLAASLLHRYNLDLANDYIDVGTLNSPTGTFPESYPQHLLRPAR